MSFLKKLFGLGGGSEPAKPAPAPTQDYNGYRIRAEPFESEGQYQTAGTIEKDIDGETKSHAFIRADRHPSLDIAVAFVFSKGRQLIDEQGDRIFR